MNIKSILKYNFILIFFFLKLFSFISCSCHGSKLNKDGYQLPMYFSQNIKIKFLFDSFEVQNINQFIIVNIICIFLGILSVCIKLLKKIVLKNSEQNSISTFALLDFSSFHNTKYAFLSFIHYIIDYILMLVVMTFNPYIFISIMVGLSSVYLFCGHLL